MKIFCLFTEFEKEEIKERKKKYEDLQIKMKTYFSKILEYFEETDFEQHKGEDSAVKVAQDEKKEKELVEKNITKRFLSQIQKRIDYGTDSDSGSWKSDIEKSGVNEGGIEERKESEKSDSDLEGDNERDGLQQRHVEFITAENQIAINTAKLEKKGKQKNIKETR
jgi:hypothetical protein